MGRDPDYDRLRERIEGELEDYLPTIGEVDFTAVDEHLAEKFGRAWGLTGMRDEFLGERGLPIREGVRVTDLGDGTFGIAKGGTFYESDRLAYDDAVGRWRDDRGRFV